MMAVIFLCKKTLCFVYPTSVALHTHVSLVECNLIDNLSMFVKYWLSNSIGYQ